VKAILQYTAVPLRNDNSELYDPLTQGAGEINAVGAVDMARVIDTSAPAGTLRATPLDPVSFRPDETLIWGQRIIWGDGFLLEAYRLVWGDSIMWSGGLRWGAPIPGTEIGVDWGTDGTVYTGIGSGNLNGGSIVWGGNIVWGGRNVRGSNIVWGDHLLGAVTTGSNVVWGDQIPWEKLSPNSLVFGPLGRSTLTGGMCASEGIF
jgi:hypothetical protein